MTQRFPDPDDWLLVHFNEPVGPDDLPMVVREHDFNLFIIESPTEWRMEVERLKALGSKIVLPSEARELARRASARKLP